MPLMLVASSCIMALAWLGHLRFKKELSFAMATLAAWLIVLPEYGLNISALRRGYGTYTGAQMAAFRLCSGVVCVALVSRFVLGEALTLRKLLGFGIMIAAMALIASGKSDAHDAPEDPTTERSAEADEAGSGELDAAAEGADGMEAT